MAQTIVITNGPYRWVNLNNTAEKIYYVITQQSFHVKLQKIGEFMGTNPLAPKENSPGRRFTEFDVNVPGRVPGNYTRWVKVMNENGRTIRLYHDTFDSAGRFVHRGIKIPGPSRHVP